MGLGTFIKEHLDRIASEKRNKTLTTFIDNARSITETEEEAIILGTMMAEGVPLHYTGVILLTGVGLYEEHETKNILEKLFDEGKLNRLVKKDNPSEIFYCVKTYRPSTLNLARGLT